MNSSRTDPLPSLRAVLMISAAAGIAAAAAEPVHGWGLVDWGMTEAQVESAYREGVDKLPRAPKRHTEVVETLHLKKPVIVNGIAMAGNFGFSQTNRGLESVVLRAELPGASTAACQGAYARIRRSQVDQFQAPLEEKPGLRSVHAIWHGFTAYAQLTEMEVTGRCFVTLIYKRPPPPQAAAGDGTRDPPAADQPAVSR